MAEAVDACRAVGAVSVANRNIDASERHRGRRKEQLEVAKGIEISEVVSPPGEAIVVTSGYELRTAERITDAHIEDQAQRLGEEHVTEVYNILDERRNCTK